MDQSWPGQALIAGAGWWGSDLSKTHSAELNHGLLTIGVIWNVKEEKDSVYYVCVKKQAVCRIEV
jgi:hypothetical protein